jgi:hypothetical protein
MLVCGCFESTDTNKNTNGEFRDAVLSGLSPLVSIVTRPVASDLATRGRPRYGSFPFCREGSCSPSTQRKKGPIGPFGLSAQATRSDQPTLRQAHRRSPRDDHVIENSHIDQRQR